MKIHNVLDKNSFAVFIYNLMYINTNSSNHKKDHIITSKVSFDEFSGRLAQVIDTTTFTILEPAIRPHKDPEIIEAIPDETKRIWEHAIYVSSETPYKTIIFTTTDKKAVYEEYKKADKKDNIIIDDENEAISKIDKYKLLCQENK